MFFLDPGNGHFNVNVIVINMIIGTVLVPFFGKISWVDEGTLPLSMLLIEVHADLMTMCLCCVKPLIQRPW